LAPFSTASIEWCAGGDRVHPPVKRVHFFAIRIESTLRGFFNSSAVLSLVVADGLSAYADGVQKAGVMEPADR